MGGRGGLPGSEQAAPLAPYAVQRCDLAAVHPRWADCRQPLRGPTAHASRHSALWGPASTSLCRHPYWAQPPQSQEPNRQRETGARAICRPHPYGHFIEYKSVKAPVEGACRTDSGRNRVPSTCLMVVMRTHIPGKHRSNANCIFGVGESKSDDDRSLCIKLMFTA